MPMTRLSLYQFFICQIISSQSELLNIINALTSFKFYTAKKRSSKTSVKSIFFQVTEVT